MTSIYSVTLRSLARFKAATILPDLAIYFALLDISYSSVRFRRCCDQIGTSAKGCNSTARAASPPPTAPRSSNGRPATRTVRTLLTTEDGMQLKYGNEPGLVSGHLRGQPPHANRRGWCVRSLCVAGQASTPSVRLTLLTNARPAVSPLGCRALFFLFFSFFPVTPLPCGFTSPNPISACVCGRSLARSTPSGIRTAELHRHEQTGEDNYLTDRRPELYGIV